MNGDIEQISVTTILNDVRNAVACNVCTIQSTCPDRSVEDDSAGSHLLQHTSNTRTTFISATDTKPCLSLQYSNQAVIEDHQLCDKYFITCAMEMVTSSSGHSTTFEGIIDTSISNPSRHFSISTSLSTISKQHFINIREGNDGSTEDSYEHKLLQILNPKIL